MLLSVVVYNHKLTAGQWVGAGIVFAGISVEALVKRTGKGHQSQAVSQGKLTIPPRDSLETRCAGKGEGKDQGIVIIPWTLHRPAPLSLYLSLFTHSNRIANISGAWTLSVLYAIGDSLHDGNNHGAERPQISGGVAKISKMRVWKNW